MTLLTHDEYLALSSAAAAWRAINEEARTLQQRIGDARLQLAHTSHDALTKGLTVPGLAALLGLPDKELAEVLNMSTPQNVIAPLKPQETRSRREARRIWSIRKVTEYLTGMLQDNLLTTPEIHEHLIAKGAWQPNNEGSKAYDALHNYFTHYRGIFFIQEGDRIRTAKPHEVVSPLQVIQRVATKTGMVNAFEFAEEFTIGPNGGKLFYNYVLTTLNSLVRAGLLESAPSIGAQACFIARPAKFEALLGVIDTYTRVTASDDEREDATLILRRIIRPDWYFEICETTQKAGRGLPPNRTARRLVGR